MALYRYRLGGMGFPRWLAFYLMWGGLCFLIGPPPNPASITAHREDREVTTSVSSLSLRSPFIPHRPSNKIPVLDASLGNFLAASHSILMTVL